jgi:hypothetical protein
MVARLGRGVGEENIPLVIFTGVRLSVSGLRVIIQRTRGTEQDVGPSVESMNYLPYEAMRP